MELRKDKVLCQLDGIEFCKRDQLDLDRVQQLPSYRYVYERYFTIISQIPTNQPKRQHCAINQLARELQYIWIYMNLVPFGHKHLVAKLKGLIADEFICKLKTWPKGKRDGIWKERFSKFSQQLDNGYDIRCKSKDVESEIAAYLGPKVTDEEEQLYYDNCVPDASGKCARLRWCSGVDTSWDKAAKKRRERLERDKFYEKQREERRQNKVKEQQQVTDEEILEVEEQKSEDICSENDKEYLPGKTSLRRSKRTRSSSPFKRGTRSRPLHATEEIDTTIPKIKVRSGYKTFNEDIMECLVIMESVYKVDGRKAPYLLKFIANTVFKQNWDVESEGKEKDDDDDKSQDRTVEHKYLDYTLPTRKTIGRWVEDFSLITLRDAAQVIANASSENKVVTYGCDDTVKAAGNIKMDIKTARITVVGEDRKRESFSTGFNRNVTHSGEHASMIVAHDIAKLAVLTNNSFEDMKSFIDFFMTDRAADSDAMLDELNVEVERRLKCNAHILLATDVAIDKIFKDTEAVIGVSTLISSGASHVFSSPCNSVWYLGLLAIAKLLSPSHSKESISLYNDYKKFLKKNVEMGNDISALSSSMLKEGFKGFQSNRFGRLGELSKAVIDHKTTIGVFFDEQVIETQNKLILAVSCYVNSEWFMTCCKVATYFYNVVTMRIKDAIGIDAFKKRACEKDKECTNTWSNIKEKFEEILSDLADDTHNRNDDVKSGEEILIKKCSEQVRNSIKRQMKKVLYFADEHSLTEQTKQKMPFAVVTNLGAESNFATVDNDLKRSGNSTSLKTVSDKHIIQQNKMYQKDRWTTLDTSEKRDLWKWARRGEESKKVKEMEDLLNTKLKSLDTMAVEAKKENKARNAERILKALEKCKKHGGPLCSNDIDKLSCLSDEQVKAEVAFLKITGSNIRYRRKINDAFVKFSIEELRMQIRQVIKPEFSETDNLDSSIRKALCPSTIELSERSKIHDMNIQMEVEKLPEVRNEEVDYVGKVGWWMSLDNECKVGAVLDDHTLQLYHPTRYGFAPDETTVQLIDYTLHEEVKNYFYIERRERILLVI